MSIEMYVVIAKFSGVSWVNSTKNPSFTYGHLDAEKMVTAVADFKFLNVIGNWYQSLS